MKVRGGPTVFEKKARVHIGGGGGVGGDATRIVTGAHVSLSPVPGACLQGGRCSEEDIWASTCSLDRKS